MHNAGLMASPRPVRRIAAAPLRARLRERYEDAATIYGIPYWGKGFFHISEDGDLVVRPTREAARGVALKQIVDEVALRGVTCPLIIRFPQILASSVASLNEAFARAIDEYEYANVFRGVFRSRSTRSGSSSRRSSRPGGSTATDWRPARSRSCSRRSRPTSPPIA